MSDYSYPVPPPTIVPEGPGLTQMQRVVYTFTAPSKTFNDIKRNTSWWLPYIIMVLFSYLLFAGITVKVTWPTVAENSIKMNPKQAEAYDKATPEARATQLKIISVSTQGIMAAAPITILIITAVFAGILLATMNFGFGGKAGFWPMFAVSMYAGLPAILKFLLGTIAIFAGLDAESFKINNFAGTNIGYYLPADTSKPLMALATSIDVITIWSLVLTGIGISIIAGTKRSSGYIAVFAWWILGVLVGVGAAAAF
jgi:hypothetical protein